MQYLDSSCFISYYSTKAKFLVLPVFKFKFKAEQCNQSLSQKPFIKWYRVVFFTPCLPVFRVLGEGT